MKRIFSAIVLIGSVFTNNQVIAQFDNYDVWENGEVHLFVDRLYTKVVLNGLQYSKSVNSLSIAKVYGNRNILLYPFRQLDWDEKYPKDSQRILTNQYLRLVKLSAELKGLKLEKKWVQDRHYHFVFSIPESQIKKIQQITSTNIISTLQLAVLEKNNKLKSEAMLELALRHPTLFNMKSIVGQFDARYGRNLLKLMTGVEIDNASEWQGNESALTEYKLDELLQLQAEYPYDQNISYYLALALKAHKYEMLLDRVIKNSLNISSVGESAVRLAQLADTWGIPYAPHTSSIDD